MLLHCKRALSRVLTTLLLLTTMPGIAATEPDSRFERCKPDLVQWLESDAAAQREPLPRALEECLRASRGPRAEPDPRLPPPPRESFAPGWKERALPVEDRSAYFDDQRSVAGVPPEWVARLPIGQLLRYEQDGERIVAVTRSYMPLLNTPNGSYWICLSRDGGRSFEMPLYTGISGEDFYTVRKRSDLPLLRRGVLRLEMWTEVAPRSVVDAEPRRHYPVLLRTELKALRRDSDGDGLTNRLELATTLNPYSRDSDGDGLADGIDAMPNLANAGPRSVRAAALEGALLRRTPPASTAARFTLPPAAGSDAFEMPILVGDPDDFRSAWPEYRIIVLSPAQAQVLAEVHRDFSPTELPLFALAAGEQRGLLRIEGGPSGRAFDLLRNGEEWETRFLGRFHHWDR